jgi:hypothetical protein
MELDDWVIQAVMTLEENCGPHNYGKSDHRPVAARRLPERSFAHRLGYGGRIDLHSDGWLVDVKTKDGLDGVMLYDEHLMQLAAYRRGAGIDKARAGILFVDRNEPKAVFLEATESQLNRGLWMFDALLLYWRWRTDYDSAWT